MQRFKNLLFFFIFIFFYSCQINNIKQYKTENSIKIALNEIKHSKYSNLYSYYKKNPIRIEFEENKNTLCSLYDLKNQTIYIPREVQNSKIALNLEVFKALYVWKIHSKYKLQEFMLEEDLLSDLNTLIYAFSLNINNKDFENDKTLKIFFKNKFCNFINYNNDYLINYLTNIYLSNNKNCNYPLETLNRQKIWFRNMKKALLDNSFIEFMYENDLEKVKKGLITMNDAIRNTALLRSKTIYDLYRDQRGYCDISEENLNDFENFYKKEMKKINIWENNFLDQKDNLRYDFTICTQ